MYKLALATSAGKSFSASLRLPSGAGDEAAKQSLSLCIPPAHRIGRRAEQAGPVFGGGLRQQTPARIHLCFGCS